MDVEKSRFFKSECTRLPAAQSHHRYRSMVTLIFSDYNLKSVFLPIKKDQFLGFKLDQMCMDFSWVHFLSYIAALMIHRQGSA